MGIELTPAFWSGLTQIIVVNILLSGDNALVIALACRNLEKRHQKPAILVGSAGAIVLRIIFVLIVVIFEALPIPLRAKSSPGEGLPHPTSFFPASS